MYIYTHIYIYLGIDVYIYTYIYSMHIHTVYKYIPKNIYTHIFNTHPYIHTSIYKLRYTIWLPFSIVYSKKLQIIAHLKKKTWSEYKINKLLITSHRGDAVIFHFLYCWTGCWSGICCLRKANVSHIIGSKYRDYVRYVRTVDLTHSHTCTVYVVAGDYALTQGWQIHLNCWTTKSPFRSSVESQPKLWLRARGNVIAENPLFFELLANYKTSP